MCKHYPHFIRDKIESWQQLKLRGVKWKTSFPTLPPNDFSPKCQQMVPAAHQLARSLGATQDCPTLIAKRQEILSALLPNAARV